MVDKSSKPGSQKNAESQAELASIKYRVVIIKATLFEHM